MSFADGGATWTGAGALGLATLFAGLGIVLFWRWRRAAASEIAAVTDSAVRELGSTLDLDAALRGALEAASELTGADAAMIVLHQDDGDALTATFGLSPEESTRDLVAPAPDSGDTGAVRLSYLYTPEEEVNDEFRLSGGLAVPLTRDIGGPTGTFAIFWRRVERTVSDSELAQFEELAQVVGPVLENARLLSEARRLAETDSVTGLHNGRYFEARLGREIGRARRYNRRLALLVFDLEREGGADLAAVGARIGTVVRATDIAGHLGEGRFAVILPETSEADAERLHRRLQFALGGRVDSSVDDVRIHAGLVELRLAEDAIGLRERAELVLERAQQPSAERLAAAQ